MPFPPDERQSASPIGSTSPAAHIWHNGRLRKWDSAAVHVNAVGHASVSAVFEGIRAYRDHRGDLLVFRLGEHLDRLLLSARLCRLDVEYDAPALAEAVLSLLRANTYDGEAYIRPWIFPSGIIREQIAPSWPPCDVVIDSWTVGSRLHDPDHCSVGVTSWRRPGASAMPAMIKAFSNYHNSRLAALEAWHHGYDWPILLNEHGHVAEGPAACIALLAGHRLITPDLASGILNSITRDTILRLARTDLRMEVVERPVDRTELHTADELFFMGTGWEVLPITSVDGLLVGSGRVGDVTRRVAALYEAVVRGKAEASVSWCTPLRPQA